MPYSAHDITSCVAVTRIFGFRQPVTARETEDMATQSRNTFGARADLSTSDGRTLGIYRLDALAPTFDTTRLPLS
jgi:hypothetical protein